MQKMMQVRLIVATLALAFGANTRAAEWKLPAQPLKLNVAILTPSESRLVDTSTFGGLEQMASYRKPMDVVDVVQRAEPLISRDIKWARLDTAPAGERSALLSVLPCTDKLGKPMSRAEAWEQAYACLQDLAAASTPSGVNALSSFAGSDTEVHVIEPEFDWIDETRDKEQAAPEQTPGRGAGDAAGFAAFEQPASPVWPSGAPGWHLDSRHSELEKAYRTIFPRGDQTQSKVVIAHLDTGVYRDPLAPRYFDKDRSVTCFETRCEPGAAPDWSGWLSMPTHGTATLSNLAGRQVAAESGRYLGGNPSATVFSINIHKSVIHLNSRRMAAGIERAVDSHADLITLSHGGLPSARLRSAVNYAYEHGVPIFAATGDYYDSPLGPARTFRSVVYPARYERVLGVAGVTANEISYGKSPPFWKMFGRGFGERVKSWALRGSYGPVWAMDNGKVIAAYSPNITRSIAIYDADAIIGNDGAGTSHATPQVAAAASLWLEKNQGQFSDPQWRGWEKAEAAYEALRASANHTFPDYSVEHNGSGILRANEALSWEFDASGAQPIIRNRAKGQTRKLAPARPASPDLPGVVELFMSAKLPGQFPHSVKRALVTALITELTQVVFSSSRLQAVLADAYQCRPNDTDGHCTAPDLSPSQWRAVNGIVQDTDDASPTLKAALELATRI